MVGYGAQEQSKPDDPEVNCRPNVNVMRPLWARESIDKNVPVIIDCSWKTIETYSQDGVISERLEAGVPYIKTSGPAIFKGCLEPVVNNLRFRPH